VNVRVEHEFGRAVNPLSSSLLQALPLSWLTTSFPLFPSSCRVISWWVRSGCSVALKFGISILTTDHVTTRCLCDVTAVRSDRDMKVNWLIANRHFLMVLRRSLVFKVWAKKTLVAFTVFQNLLYGMSCTFWAIGKSDENGLYSQNACLLRLWIIYFTLCFQTYGTPVFYHVK